MPAPRPLDPRSALDALESAGIAIAIADARLPEVPLVHVNAAAARLMGCAAEELAGQPARLLAAPDADARDLADLEAAMRIGAPWRGTLLSARKDGSTFMNELVVTPLFGADGHHEHVVAVLRDVTTHTRTADELLAIRHRYERVIDDLAAAELRYRELVERVPAVIYLSEFDEQFTLRYLSPQVQDMLGHPAQAFIDDQELWYQLIHPADVERVRAAERDAYGSQTGDEMEYRMIAADGRLVWVCDRDEIVRDEDGRALFAQGVVIDITARRSAEAQIAHLAYHDSLTGLPNRALLHEHLELALARARRNDLAVALLYLDLDDFKLVNDSLGHGAGDELLGRVAQELRDRTRASDLLVRQGGDEFLVLLSDLERAGAEAAAQAAAASLRGALSEPFRIAGAEFHIGASVGISLYPGDAGDAATLLKHADAAMYQAKAAGRGEVVTYADDLRRPIERLSLSTRLRRAISEDELVLHWQPIVSLADGSVAAAEALVRWRDPERGLQLPDAFVPFAEETGLIGRLGSWVADAVSAQRLAWRAAGLDPRVHLNVSPRQLARRGFVADLVGRLGVGGLDLSAVTLEITESLALRDDGRAVPLLHELHETGVELAIDDFGAGWSSLGRLRDLPVQVVKIDRSFLAGVPGSPQGAAILGAMLALVEALGLEAVAEGVEDDAQRAFLRSGGCRLGQGYLLGRPMPADELDHLLAVEPVGA